MGVSYLYQPPFTQQLGVFAKAYHNPPYENIIIHVNLKNIITYE